MYQIILRGGQYMEYKGDDVLMSIQSFYCLNFIHRDASFGPCSYNLTLLDCLHGLNKVWISSL